MNTRIMAVYGRQSVDKKDSISIESQIEFCKYELKGDSWDAKTASKRADDEKFPTVGNFSCDCVYREYTDKGYSGKNTDRPKFQELIRDIEQGLISKVVVYKLDRISRSIIDFARMMEMFGKYNVEFVSATEKFDTSTPMGRAMLNICIVFAQLERETIQKRVQDSFYSRCQRGFFMSGAAPYGYKLEPTVIDGINTKKMAADPEAAARVRLMYEMYAKPNTSFGDIIRHFAKNGIKTDVDMTSSQISNMLKNPIYAQADLDVYEFFKSLETQVVNDAADFTGTNGCYFYKGQNVSESKRAGFKGHMLVVAPHEGLVPSETWLACRKKLLNNVKFQVNHKAKNTWLAGKIKCGRCESALNGSAGKYNYFHCRRRKATKTFGCAGCGRLLVSDVENFIYNEMVKKLSEFRKLTGGNPKKINPKLTALSVELAQVETEIENLLDTLTGANKTLLSYANSKIEELDEKRQSLTKAIADMKTSTISPQQVKSISGYLQNWDNIELDDKRIVLDGLVSRVLATSESVKIKWKI